MFKYILLSLTILIFWGCNSNKNRGEIRLDSNFDKSLEKVASKKIYFGHQSVGKNIIEGINDILSTKPDLKIDIFESENELPDAGGFILHTPIGENTRPNLKCDDFIRQLQPDLVSKLDLAMFKFCYIDINRETDVAALFDYYKNTIAQLRQQYPGLKIIHFTAPLRHTPTDFKTSIKEFIGNLMGKQNNSKLDNVKRNEFNALLKSYYRAEPVFDLARAEATYPDGKENTFEMNGMTNYNLIGSYTYDGGHLNETGRKKVAADLIMFLATM